MKPPVRFPPGARERFLSILKRVYPRELGAEAGTSSSQCEECLWPLDADTKDTHACDLLRQRTLAYLVSPRERQMALLKLALNNAPYQKDVAWPDGAVKWRKLLESRSVLEASASPSLSLPLTLSLSGALTFPLTLANAIAALPPEVAAGGVDQPLRVAVVGARAEAAPEMDVLWEEVGKALSGLETRATCEGTETGTSARVARCCCGR